MRYYSMQKVDSTMQKDNTTEQKKVIEYELTHEQENRRERLADEAYHKIESYGDIKLIFGKHKGKTLNELKDTETDYLLWLLDVMEKETKKHSPTQIAIMKYIKHCV